MAEKVTKTEKIQTYFWHSSLWYINKLGYIFCDLKKEAWSVTHSPQNRAPCLLRVFVHLRMGFLIMSSSPVYLKMGLLLTSPYTGVIGYLKIMVPCLLQGNLQFLCSRLQLDLVSQLSPSWCLCSLRLFIAWGMIFYTLIIQSHFILMIVYFKCSQRSKAVWQFCWHLAGKSIVR